MRLNTEMEELLACVLWLQVHSYCGCLRRTVHRWTISHGRLPGSHRLWNRHSAGCHHHLSVLWDIRERAERRRQHGGAALLERPSLQPWLRSQLSSVRTEEPQGGGFYSGTMSHHITSSPLSNSFTSSLEFAGPLNTNDGGHSPAGWWEQTPCWCCLRTSLYFMVLCFIRYFISCSHYLCVPSSVALFWPGFCSVEVELVLQLVSGFGFGFTW